MTGLVRNSVAPSAYPSSLSSVMVTMMTGISSVSGSAFSARSTSQPSIPGIRTSSVMAAGFSLRARSSAS